MLPYSTKTRNSGLGRPSLGIAAVISFWFDLILVKVDNGRRWRKRSQVLSGVLQGIFNDGSITKDMSSP